MNMWSSWWGCGLNSNGETLEVLTYVKFQQKGILLLNVPLACSPLQLISPPYLSFFPLFFMFFYPS